MEKSWADERNSRRKQNCLYMLNPLKLHWQYPGTGMPRTAVGVGKRPYICSSAPCSASRRFSYALNIFHIMRGSGCRDFLHALHDGRARCPRTLRHVAALHEHITIVIYVTNLSDLAPSKKPTKKLRWRAVRITKKRSSGRQKQSKRVQCYDGWEQLSASRAATQRGKLPVTCYWQCYSVVSLHCCESDSWVSLIVINR